MDAFDKIFPRRGRVSSAKAIVALHVALLLYIVSNISQGWDWLDIIAFAITLVALAISVLDLQREIRIRRENGDQK